MASHDDTATFSPEKTIDLRSEGFAWLRYHADQVSTIGTAIEAVDAALQVQMVNRGSDEQQALVNAGRNLAAILNGESGPFLESSHVENEAIPASDHEQELKTAHFEAWIAQASPEELDGLRRSQELVTIGVAPW